MVKNVLVIGAASLLGDRLVKTCMNGSSVYYTVNRTDIDIHGAMKKEMDITNAAQVQNVFSDIKPDIAVLVAAYAEVDKCEKNKELAWKINVEGVEHVLKACAHHGTKLVYISTDALFDGTKSTPYLEDDIPNPPNFYALTKQEAEKIVLGNPENLVCRVSTLYGKRAPHHRQNVIMWMVETMQAGKQIELFEDRYANPTFADEAARVITEITMRNGHGIFHTTGRDCVSRVQLGMLIADVFELNKELIVPVKSRDYQEIKRGLHSCVSVEKAEKFIGRRIQTLRESLIELKAQLTS